MSGMLPFIEDTAPSKVKRGKYNEKSEEPPIPTTAPTVVTSLSYDQVNDNVDELIELRGEGRYFGVTDPSNPNAAPSLGPICANCHKRGHIRAKCKTVICHKCGVVGDHYETHCPTTLICARCGEKGHIANNCRNKAKKRLYCRSCDTFSHGDENCPSIWRSYLTKPEPKDEESLALPVVYCYNCGNDEHYGDECPEPRSSRVPNFGTAFSGSNLPRKYRPLYFLRLKKNSKRGRDNDVYNPESAVRDYQSDYYLGTRNYFNNTPGFGSVQLNNKMPSRSGYIAPAFKNNNYRGNASIHKATNYGNKNNGYRNNESQKSNNLRAPSRSGMISSYNSKVTKPTRSGLIADSGNGKKKNKNGKSSKIMRY